MGWEAEGGEVDTCVEITLRSSVSLPLVLRAFATSSGARHRVSSVKTARRRRAGERDEAGVLRAVVVELEARRRLTAHEDKGQVHEEGAELLEDGLALLDAFLLAHLGEHRACAPARAEDHEEDRHEEQVDEQVPKPGEARRRVGVEPPDQARLERCAGGLRSLAPRALKELEVLGDQGVDDATRIAVVVLVES